MAAFATYRGEGRCLQVIAGGAVAPGDVKDFGDFVGFARNGGASGDLINYDTRGEWRVPKKSGETWTQGQPVYYDAGTASFSNNGSYSEAAAGFVSVAAASGDATGDIILTPGIART